MLLPSICTSERDISSFAKINTLQQVFHQPEEARNSAISLSGLQEIIENLKTVRLLDDADECGLPPQATYFCTQVAPILQHIGVQNGTEKTLGDGGCNYKILDRHFLQ